FGHRIILAVATLVHARCQVIGPQKRCQSSLPYWLPLHNHRRNMLKIIPADRIWKVAVSRLH
ncbi:hypothetical protein, partial [Klebsiella pneumoniae]|uniref:hypothetical protein n=1 Tax=Klebsiella pneumoniae TaxID=573 RepID=UPI0021E86709